MPRPNTRKVVREYCVVDIALDRMLVHYDILAGGRQFTRGATIVPRGRIDGVPLVPSAYAAVVDEWRKAGAHQPEVLQELGYGCRYFRAMHNKLLTRRVQRATIPAQFDSPPSA